MAANSNIRKRKTANGDRFEARYRDAAGKERQRTFVTRRAAEKFQAERRADVVRGLARDEDKGATTFEAYAERWLEMKAGKVRPVTLDGYRLVLDRHVLPFLGSKPVGSISSATLLAYVAALSAKRSAKGYGLAPASIRHAWIPVQQVLAFALLDGALHLNPSVGIPLPSRNTAPKPVPFKAVVLEPAELAALSDALDARDPTGVDSLVVRFLANSGLRAAELSGLNVDDFNSLGRTIKVARTRTMKAGTLVTGEPKSERSTRVVPLPRWLTAELDAYLDATHAARQDTFAPLFPARLSRTATGTGVRLLPFDWSKPIEPGTFRQRRFRPALKAAGLPSSVRLHDLRHTFGTNLVSAGVPLAVVSRVMGHASVATTDAIYSHLRAEQHHDAVDLLLDPRKTAPPAATTLRRAR